MSARAGWVYLVGAGPGDPGLLTLRGAELLGAADIILHDELIDTGVLVHARSDAEVCSVGKRGADAPEKRKAQGRINERMIAAAQQGQRVVRLKGGDPFLFGRGAEEVTALRDAGVPFEVVPGISAPVGATAYAGIPLTHRDHASGVAFVTAVQRGGEPFDFAELHGFRGTLCVFMGARHLASIGRAIVEQAGRNPNTPCAVVSWISYPRQRTVIGTLSNIATRAAGAPAPALLICGDVVAVRESLRWFDTQPLFGRRVLVTRPAHQAASTVRALRQRGAEPVAFPTIAIEPPPDPAAVTRSVAALASYDLVAFTSDNAVTAFFEAIDRAGLDARAFGRAKLAAIGTGTAAGLRRRGLRPDVVAEVFVAESLAEAILAVLPEAGRVLLPRARVAREILPRTLREAGHHVDVVPVYETVTASVERAEQLRALLPSIDVVMLTASSTVTELCRLLGEHAAEALAHVTLASIGPITTQTATELGLDVRVTAEHSTAQGLIDALEAHFAHANDRAP